MASNKVALKTLGRIDELRAAAGITPSHLVEVDSAGKVVVHNTAGGRAQRLFATEDQLQGKIIANAYVSTDLVSLIRAVPGDEINCLLKAGENVAIGAELVSGGDGTLIAAGTLASAGLNLQTIGYAVESLDLSASGAVAARLAVSIV